MLLKPVFQPGSRCHRHVSVSGLLLLKDSTNERNRVCSDGLFTVPVSEPVRNVCGPPEFSTSLESFCFLFASLKWMLVSFGTH